MLLFLKIFNTFLLFYQLFYTVHKFYYNIHSIIVIILSDVWIILPFTFNINLINYELSNIFRSLPIFHSYCTWLCYVWWQWRLQAQSSSLSWSSSDPVLNSYVMRDKVSQVPDRPTNDITCLCLIYNLPHSSPRLTKLYYCKV